MASGLIAFLFLFLPAPASASPGHKLTQLLPPDDPHIQYSGRVDLDDPKAPRFDWPGVSITLRFKGDAVGFRLQDGGNDYNLSIDAKPATVFATQARKTDYVLSGLSQGTHTAVLSKRTEGSFGGTVFKGVLLPAGAEVLDPPPKPARRIEFLGASWVCGYGNEGHAHKCDDLRPLANNDLAFGSVAARRLGAEWHSTAFSGIGVVRNYGDPKAASAAPYGAYFGRTLVNDPQSQWDFKRWVPDVVVLNLGLNDFSTGPRPQPPAFIARYMGLLARVRAAYPDAWLVSYNATGWPDFVPHVHAAVAEFKARGDRRALSLEFGSPLTQASACDHHPNVQEHQRLGEDLAARLAPLWEGEAPEPAPGSRSELGHPWSGTFKGPFRYDFKGPLDGSVWERAKYSMDDVGSLMRESDARAGAKALSLFVEPLLQAVGRHRFSGSGIMSRAFFGPGRFTVRMRSDIKPGTVSSFFLMNKWVPGRWFHKEIDIEFLGRDPRTVQFVTHRYYSDQGNAGLGEPRVHMLPFGYADGFHDYSIRWTAKKVEWSVDGAKVWETERDVPDEPLNILMNHWGPGPDEAWSKAWVGPMDLNSLPSRAEYEWVTYEPEQGEAP